VAARLDMAATPAVKVFRNFPNVAGEPSTAEFDFFTESGFNTEMVFDFLKTETFPTLAEITPENYGQYEKRGLPFVWIFVPGRGKSGGTSEEGPVENTPEEAAQQQKILDTCRAVANKFRSKISFVYLSAIDYQQHAESLGLNLDTLPAILLNEQSDDGKKFLFNGSFSEESFAVFVQNYLDGKLAPFRKSEPAPASNDGPVKVVVADTFDALVWDNDKDVFIEFYAPWCQHCKRLEPLWNEIGELLKQKSDKIIIAKIDATANDVPAEVQGFPTLYFKKKGAAKGKLDKEMFYEGDRTKQAILRYIKEKSSADLSDLAIPADVERIRSFIGDLDRIKDELTRLLDENARLKKQVGAADGSPHDDAGFPADSLKQEGHDEL
jgi:protein disulfide-isomerase A1